MRNQAVDGAEEEMRAQLAAHGLDMSVPNVARIYDFMLGGKDNFAADRQAAERVMREIPHSALACRQNRDFLGRAVHTATGKETGPGGHVAAPIDADLVRAAMAREAGGRA